MFFTNVGSVVAWLAFILGSLQALLGVVLVVRGDPVEAASLLGRMYTWAAIDQGLTAALFGIGLGILTEISESVCSEDKRPLD